MGENSLILEDLLETLYVIAIADGWLHEAEARYLASIAEIFKLSPEQTTSIKLRHSLMLNPTENAYSLLGVSSSSSMADIRQAYRKLVKRYHPDYHIAAGLPPELIKISEARMAALTEAYHHLTNLRLDASLEPS